MSPPRASRIYCFPSPPCIASPGMKIIVKCKFVTARHTKKACILFFTARTLLYLVKRDENTRPNGYLPRKVDKNRWGARSCVHHDEINATYIHQAGVSYNSVKIVATQIYVLQHVNLPALVRKRENNLLTMFVRRQQQQQQQQPRRDVARFCLFSLALVPEKRDTYARTDSFSFS